MTQTNRIVGDLQVTGNLSSGSMTIADSAVTNAKVAAAAGIEASKLQHQYIQKYSQPNTTATAVTQAVHVATGAGVVESFAAGSIAACTGDATITVDLKKNGTTMLTAVITLDSANTAYVAEAGAISGGGTYAAGDVLTIVVTVNAGTGALATGLFAAACLREAAA